MPPPLCARFRRAIVVPAALIGLALVATTTLVLTDPQWAREAGLDLWNQPALEQQIEEDTSDSRYLTHRREDVLHRIEVKESLARQLITGQVSLAGATTQFLALDRDRPAYIAVIRRNQPGVTDEERMARNVIQYALARVADTKERERLSQRLADEFRGLFPSATEPAIPPIRIDPPTQHQQHSGWRKRSGAK